MTTPEIPPSLQEDVVWWRSKKFIATMVSEITYKVIILVILYIVMLYQGGTLSAAWLTLLVTVIVTAGTIQIGFLGGQAWIDRYAKVLGAGKGLIPSKEVDSSSRPPEDEHP